MKDSINRMRLRGLIAEKGFNVSSFARACGVSRTTMSLFFSGQAPRFNLANAIVQVLQLSPAEAGEVFFARNLHSM